MSISKMPRTAKIETFVTNIPPITKNVILGHTITIISNGTTQKVQMPQKAHKKLVITITCLMRKTIVIIKIAFQEVQQAPESTVAIDHQGLTHLVRIQMSHLATTQI